MRNKLLSILIVFIMFSVCFNYEYVYTQGISGNVLRGDMNTLDANGGEFSSRHSIVVKSDGSLWEWGVSKFSNRPTELATDFSVEPIKVMDDVKLVSVGYLHTMAIKSDGSLWVWGQNRYGQLGNNTYEDSEIPIKIMDDVMTISAGGHHSLALKKDGSLWGWGLNEQGQLGFKPNEEEIKQKTPIKLMDNVAAVSAGAYYTMIIKKDGSLWGSGGGRTHNEGGASMGDGTFDAHYSFIKIMDNVIAVSSGTIHTAAIKNDGSLWTWGNNGGKLGNGTYKKSAIPVKVMDDVIAVSAGESHTMAIKNDGSLWAWGQNYYGQIGDGTNGWDATRTVPVKIMDEVSVVCVGAYHSLAIKTDGSLWGWGSNSKGELGDGTIENKLIPTKIMEQVKISKNSATSAVTSRPLQTQKAVPTSSIVLVDSKEVSFEAYNINGNNYFKLRDIAMVVNGTDKQFQVGWDGEANAISLTTGESYTAVGGELQVTDDKVDKTANPNTSKVYLDGKEVNFTAYNIGGNNYFKLRDVAAIIDFGVTWDGNTNTIGIDTSIGYTP